VQHPSIDELLAEARSCLRRVTPHEALAAVGAGAVLVDIRPLEQRRLDGVAPCATVVDRNVLEWRLDPQCDHRIPELARRDHCVILLCNEGYQSSLAAATLRTMGLDATDVDGGFRAWVAAGLPVVAEAARER
jgi:rhodanese-related sulfurtransferase